MNTIKNIIFACLLLFGCSQEDDNLTYIQAKIDGKASALPYIEAESTVTYQENDTIKYLSIFALNSSEGKIMIEIQTKELKQADYYFGYRTDSVFLAKATFERDTNFYSTTYTKPELYRGKLTITKIEPGYIKGTFEFNAFSKELTDSVVITEGKFFSELK